MALDPAAVVIAVGGVATGIAGAYAAFRKAGPQSSQILVDAAKDVVVIQRDAMEDLRRRVDALEEEVTSLRAENTKLKGELTRARTRIKHLEEEVKE